MTDQTRTCLIPDCRGTLTDEGWIPALAGDGIEVCEWHYRRYRGWIAELVDLYAILPTMLDPASRPDRSGVRPRRTDPPAPLRLEVVALMDPRTQTTDSSMHVLGVLGSWAALVREERGITPPAQETMTSVQRTLAANAPWCAAQSWFGDMYGEVESVVDALRAATGMRPPRPVGYCHLPGKGSDEKCHGAVFEIEGTGGLRCSRCHETWRSAQEIARFDLIHGSSA